MQPCINQINQARLQGLSRSNATNSQSWWEGRMCDSQCEWSVFSHGWMGKLVVETLLKIIKAITLKAEALMVDIQDEIH